MSGTIGLAYGPSVWVAGSRFRSMLAGGSFTLDRNSLTADVYLYTDAVVAARAAAANDPVGPDDKQGRKTW